MQFSKFIYVISLLAGLIAFFAKCVDNGSVKKDPRGQRYAGAKACVSCHQDVYASHTRSNHYKTSSAIDYDRLSGTVPAGNRFYFQDSSQVRIGKQDHSFYQAHFVNGINTLSYQYDIAFGSGEKAQTYASWQKGKLFQLPLSYFAAVNTWANSPGFPISHARFNRVVESRCFECHAAYINRETEQSGPLSVSEKLDPRSVIYGIDCERCHGPAADHVVFHSQNPGATTGKFITSIKTLTRQQKLDMCAVCHSGNDRELQRSTFAFRPGDTLTNFYYPSFGMRNEETDVHGKQMQLLQMSLCFQKSNMTCGTCHEPHQNAKGAVSAIMTKCVDCHQQSVHVSAMIRKDAQAGKDRPIVNTNCIDCHMPLQASKMISFNSSAGVKTIPYLLRTHKIAIYH